MVSLASLWLPILLSAVFVFVVSSIIHMVLPWHNNDYPLLPNQDQVMDALRPLGVPPGDYMIPRPANRKEMSSPEFIEKVKRGPVMMLTVRSGGFNMGKNLAMWFVYNVFVALFAAYVAGRTLPAGTNYMHVFQIIGAVAFIGYSLALWQMSVWYDRKLSITIKLTIDGFVYGLVVAGTFGWLWPH